MCNSKYIFQIFKDKFDISPPPQEVQNAMPYFHGPKSASSCFLDFSIQVLSFFSKWIHDGIPLRLFLPASPYILEAPHTKCENIFLSFCKKINEPLKSHILYIMDYIIWKTFLNLEVFSKFIESESYFKNINISYYIIRKVISDP